jgi:hypothetical protein
MGTLNYRKDIVERTKRLIETHYDCIKKTSQLEVTFLINCLLGLVVAVSENKKGKGKVKDKIFLQNILKTEYLDKSYDWFLPKIRNAIAHQNIEPRNDSENKKWTGVKMWNWNEHNKKKDFEIELTNEELKDLALKIAEDYLNQENNQKN